MYGTPKKNNNPAELTIANDDVKIPIRASSGFDVIQSPVMLCQSFTLLTETQSTYHEPTVKDISRNTVSEMNGKV